MELSLLIGIVLVAIILFILSIKYIKFIQEKYNFNFFSLSRILSLLVVAGILIFATTSPELSSNISISLLAVTIIIILGTLIYNINSIGINGVLVTIIQFLLVFVIVLIFPFAFMLIILVALLSSVRFIFLYRF
ncbi:hypothetical protein [Fuchsiella alkaliacetigena]|uniref:hypothetical protein n=1 Tax=Fuchsiella alkaliacetigena TaxID=957042 RepID=UPI002009E4AB|nr:hypothetical protein [Fuchsiella alkaliacetigena]MCK8826033.1 hypothetical protein [Fuchsiella alkaliacetigena]